MKQQRINLKNLQATPEAQFQKNKWSNQKMGQRTKHTFPTKTYRWLTYTWKDAQHHSLSEKCKSKPQWGIISRKSEWLLSKNLQAINAGEDVEKREPSYTIGGMQTSTATMENSVEIPLKPGNKTAIWPSNPTAGHTHWGNQNWKRHMYPNIHQSTVYNNQDMEAT